LRGFEAEAISLFCSREITALGGVFTNHSLRALSGLSERYPRQRLIQFRQIPLQDSPDNLKVNTEIFMNDPVSQSNDLKPFYLRMTLLEFVGQPIGGLTHNFKISGYGINGFLIF
jgi:hypothetical protein